jgi:hypothetical protein
MKTFIRCYYSLIAACFLSANLSEVVAADANLPPRLTIELRDGSRVVGTSTERNLKFHSALLGDFKLAVEDIRSIDCVSSNSAKLATVNGDVFLVWFVNPELRVSTSFGKVELPVNSLRHAAVSVVGNAGRGHEGRVALWSGEGSANDSVGSNNGSPIGTLNYTNGKVGKAFSFDGTSYVLIPNSPSLNPPGAFSIEGWIYPMQDADQKILSKWEDQGDSRSYSFTTIPGLGLSFAISDLANQRNGYFHTFAVNGVLKLNGWNHVAATYDSASGVRCLFVNGALVASKTNSPIAVYNSDSPVTIGAWIRSQGFNQDYFEGLIDELSFFNRALSAQEIREDYETNNSN